MTVSFLTDGHISISPTPTANVFFFPQFFPISFTPSSGSFLFSIVSKQRREWDKEGGGWCGSCSRWWFLFCSVFRWNKVKRCSSPPTRGGRGLAVSAGSLQVMVIRSETSRNASRDKRKAHLPPSVHILVMGSFQERNPPFHLEPPGCAQGGFSDTLSQKLPGFPRRGGGVSTGRLESFLSRWRKRRKLLACSEWRDFRRSPLCNLLLLTQTLLEILQRFSCPTRLREVRWGMFPSSALLQSFTSWENLHLLQCSALKGR